VLGTKWDYFVAMLFQQSNIIEKNAIGPSSYPEVLSCQQDLHGEFLQLFKVM